MSSRREHGTIRLVATDCKHRLCELIGGACSLATGRSRGCRQNLTAKDVAPAVFDEVRTLLGIIDSVSDPNSGSEEAKRPAAIRLAALIRREALEDRHLLAHARADEPELVPALERLCLRRP